MEAIKRQIFVLRDTLKDCIDYTLGTDMVPIEYHVMDFTIPATATAVVYVLRPDGDLDKILADVLDNVISFTPTKGFFAEGLNAIQIRIVNNNKALVSFTETVRVGKSMKFDDDAEAQQETLIEQVMTKVGECTGKIQIEITERKEAIAEEAEIRRDAIDEEARIRKETDEKKANSADLKKHAYRETVKTLTATEEGHALDSTMGKTLKNEIVEVDKRAMNKYASDIGNPPSINYSYFVNATSMIPIGDITIPQYSKGVFMTNGGSDGCLLMVDAGRNLYVGFRNGGSWTGRKI